MVALINGDEELIVHAVSTDVEAPRLLSGTIKIGINTIDILLLQWHLIIRIQ